MPRENRRKVSKIISDTFWCSFALREKCRKLFLTLFDAAPFRWPLLQSADLTFAAEPPRHDSGRERKMRTNFLSTNCLNTPKGPGHPGEIPGTSQVPPYESQRRQTFEGEHEVFDPHPFAWKTPTPPGGLRTQKVIISVLFFLAFNLRVFLRICHPLTRNYYKANSLRNIFWIFALPSRSPRKKTFFKESRVKLAIFAKVIILEVFFYVSSHFRGATSGEINQFRVENGGHLKQVILKPISFENSL